MKQDSLALDFKALGTNIHIEIVFDINSLEKKEKAKADLESLKNIYAAKQKVFCRFNPESELNRLNRALGKYAGASADMLQLASRALFYNEKSGGIYDPRVIGILEKIGYLKDFAASDFSKMQVPEIFGEIETSLAEDLKINGKEIFFGKRMDFSGIAKGYITDCAAEYLKMRGWKNFIVDSGGDMNISGKNREGKKWRIAIEGIPEKKLMLELTERGIATSGISRKKWQIGGKKFHHLVNPKKPNEFSYELRTVTVIEKNTENADGRAKVLMLLGKEKGFKFAKTNKTAAIFLDYKGDIFVTPEAKKYIL